ncbi:MAG: hypothetical protein HAW62_04965 [Endozoicomonadaceae bacterium]|nr:hypothetical protein [Endozoicomonadaceae bacterium]
MQLASLTGGILGSNAARSMTAALERIDFLPGSFSQEESSQAEPDDQFCEPLYDAKYLFLSEDFTCDSIDSTKMHCLFSHLTNMSDPDQFCVGIQNSRYLNIDDSDLICPKKEADILSFLNKDDICISEIDLRETHQYCTKNGSARFIEDLLIHALKAKLKYDTTINIDQNNYGIRIIGASSCIILGVACLVSCLSIIRHSKKNVDDRQNLGLIDGKDRG